jgi:hypothetical protein
MCTSERALDESLCVGSDKMDFVLFFFFLLSLSSSSVMFVPVLYGLSILESLRENRKLAKKEAVGLPIPTVFFFSFPFCFLGRQTEGYY